MVMVADVEDVFPINNNMFFIHGSVSKIKKSLSGNIEILFDEFHTSMSEYHIETTLYFNKNEVGRVVFNQSYSDSDTTVMYIMGNLVDDYDIKSAYELMRWFLLGLDSTKQSRYFFVDREVLVIPFVTSSGNGKPTGVFFAKMDKKILQNPEKIVKYREYLLVTYNLYTNVRVCVEISPENKIRLMLSKTCGSVLYHQIDNLHSDVVFDNFMYGVIS